MAIASAPGSRPANDNADDITDDAPAVRDAMARIEQDGYVAVERVLSPVRIAAARDGLLYRNEFRTVRGADAIPRHGVNPNIEALPPLLPDLLGYSVHRRSWGMSKACIRGA
ncbi:MAG TPA: hypothetical protein VGD08_02710 [Stellaceae bacterium]